MITNEIMKASTKIPSVDPTSSESTTVATALGVGVGTEDCAIVTTVLTAALIKATPTPMMRSKIVRGREVIFFMENRPKYNMAICC